MTELRIKLRRDELDYLLRNAEHVITADDSTYISRLVRYRILEAIKRLGLEVDPKRSHHRKTPPGDGPITDPDPYADEPEEDA
jgi:hypothetical protein